MHCSACSSAVEKALTAMPGVRSASVSLVMRRATIVADAAIISPVRRRHYTLLFAGLGLDWACYKCNMQALRGPAPESSA